MLKIHEEILTDHHGNQAGNWYVEGFFCGSGKAGRLRANSIVDAYAFIASIARMTQDGEEVDGEEFVMENDDAIITLNELIESARNLKQQLKGE